MNRFVPDHAETREFAAAAVVAYCYDHKGGPAFVAYKGRKAKPTRHNAYRTAELRDADLAAYVAAETSTENQRRERREVGHGLAVGDIVYSTWGYEQTNVDFFQVVRVPSGRSAVVRALAKDITPSGEGRMSGKASPRAGQFLADAPENLHRANGAERLSGGKSAYGSLYKWDGKPKSVTSYA